jgi:hypothetical protein
MKTCRIPANTEIDQLPVDETLIDQEPINDNPPGEQNQRRRFRCRRPRRRADLYGHLHTR